MIVIDASIALKWLKEGESYRDEALSLYQRHKTGKELIIAPSLIFIEIANALVTKSATTEETIKKSLSIVFKTNLKIHETDNENLIQASTFAKKFKTSVYDMLYAVVAKERSAILYTADEKFIEKTGFKFVKHIKDF
ncbi:hypothetical protein A2714_04220 [Candidatus Woesebacteria bacterium RIFCSPHIGHO2_01_FULL_38_9]|uniref:PIN domain-containing protein n=2 Tax=Candidatus Woeseibacteriota TaxID=1752722 RepID=A0A1F7XXY0_9BACT|nr:MAG: hypothetical protein A2714_04220 [Candidatus Woesebacteria bacterium RIFCSPHIGHO2_01_FULL_38_9]OGM58978.1 MAG: hypothetical protein A3A75_00505 [Candidatus Woesebacteria bacterium RIFCSPLOWO2_01_FULL_39_10]